jgi:hypothetical protein
MCSKLANSKKQFVNPFTKTPIFEQPNQFSHTWVFFWAKQASTTIHLDTFLHTPQSLKAFNILKKYFGITSYMDHRRTPLNNIGQNFQQ